MNIDRENINCYNCRDFEHLVRNYRNRGTRDRIRKERRLEYRNKAQEQNNLNEEGNLITLD